MSDCSLVGCCWNCSLFTLLASMSHTHWCITETSTIVSDHGSTYATMSTTSKSQTMSSTSLVGEMSWALWWADEDWDWWALCEQERSEWGREGQRCLNTPVLVQGHQCSSLTMLGKKLWDNTHIHNHQIISVLDPWLGSHSHLSPCPEKHCHTELKSITTVTSMH